METIQPRAYRVQAAAKLLGLTGDSPRAAKEAIYKLIHSGKLTAFRTGDAPNSRYMVTADSIERLLASGE